MPGTSDPQANIKELFRAKKDPSLSSVPGVAAQRSPQQIKAIGFAEARRAQGEDAKPHAARGQRGKPGPKPKGKYLG